MDKIRVLLAKLNNKVTPQIAKRLDGLDNLNSKFELAKKELEANPKDEELQESLKEITEYVDDFKEDLIEDLEDLIEARKIENPKGEETPNGDKKEKSSAGITGMIIGGVLLIASIGVINILKKK